MKRLTPLLAFFILGMSLLASAEKPQDKSGATIKFSYTISSVDLSTNEDVLTSGVYADHYVAEATGEVISDLFVPLEIGKEESGVENLLIKPPINRCLVAASSRHD